MLGKRFQRTTSMAQIGPACSIKPSAAPEQAAAAAADYQRIAQWDILKQAEDMMKKMMAAASASASAGGRPAGDAPAASRAGAGAAATRQPSELIARGTFLDTCCFCKRRLRQERDIFIYRGDSAFCTEECRHRHILRDERSTTAAKEGSPAAEAAVAA